MQWFRVYHGTPSDPKFGHIARRTGQTRERVVFVWLMILASASENSDRDGAVTVTADGIGDVLNCPTDDVQAIVDELFMIGMLELKDADGLFVLTDFTAE